MNGLLAIAERELRKFFHSPLLLFVALIGPLVQLMLMGNAFGGKVTKSPVGIVDLDHGSQSVRLREAFQAIAANADTFRTVECADERQAKAEVASGRLKAAVIIPAQFTRRTLRGDAPRLGLVLDNTDAFVSASVQQKLQEVVAARNAKTTGQTTPASGQTTPASGPRLQETLQLDAVEIFPYIRYIKFLLPGIMALSIFLSVMFGGGMLYNEDRIRGVHEGFLVTPIRSLEMVGGMVLAGTVKATICGMLVAILGSTLAGMNLLFHPFSLLLALLITVAAGFAFNSLMFLLMGTIDDPMTPKVLAGLLNTLLFFPSGAIYPLEAFPVWLRALSTVNPMTYAVHALRAVLLRHVGLAAVALDILVLLLIGAAGLALAARFFKRTL